MSGPMFDLETRKRLVLQALRNIKRFPDQWDQNAWHCGTACCFAGHLGIAAGFQFENVPVILGETFTEYPGGGSDYMECPVSGITMETCKLGAAIYTGSADSSPGAFSADNTFAQLVRDARSRDLITDKQARQLLRRKWYTKDGQEPGRSA